VVADVNFGFQILDLGLPIASVLDDGMTLRGQGFGFGSLPWDDRTPEGSQQQRVGQLPLLLRFFLLEFRLMGRKGELVT